MKKILFFLIILSGVKGYSQVLDSKDSCVTENPLRGFKHSYLSLRANLPLDEFLIFRSRQEFEKEFRRANSYKRDSIISIIDFERNNVIVFSTFAGGCRLPTVLPEYFVNNILQVKITWNGGCNLNLPIGEYIIVPKEIPVNIKVRVCKVYIN